MLAMQYQLELSQWWPPEVLQQQQFAQLNLLVKHAYQTVPFYREHFRGASFDPGAKLTPERFAQLPLLRRRDIQSAGQALLSQQVPTDHGEVGSGKTSGSTGIPIQYFSTQLTGFLFNVLSLRDNLWHGRDFRRKLAVIRESIKHSARDAWGIPTSAIFDTGPYVSLDIRTDLATQLTWLQEEQPDYLVSYPSNIEALAALCVAKGIRLEGLREVRTLSETLSPELRVACREAWGVPIADMYSASEIGYIALQCPDYEHYHIQSEAVLVEVLSAEGQPCGPGEIGRIVLTSLHNFAMPLIRYEIGDYVQLGEPCPCGRGLPVITRIMGRLRNLVTLPDGRQNWPILRTRYLMEVFPLRQIQVVQRSLEQIEVKLVVARPLLPEEESKYIAILQGSLGYPFQISFSYHDAIPRSASGKYEDFVSAIV